MLKNEVAIPASPYLKCLDYGTGATVYMLKRSKFNAADSPWAIKKINKTLKNSLYEKRLCKEATILKQLNHPNIVGFRNFSKNLQGDCCLAMEKCDESLGQIIEYRSENDLGMFPADNISKVIEDIAKALVYLHEQQILHGDIKSNNILVKNKFQICKLCDFGCSRKLDEDGVLSKDSKPYIGTGPWMPPEAIVEDGIISSKSDMFAYGLVLWEMVTLQIPHCEWVFENSKNESTVEELLNKSISFNDDILSDNYGKRPEIPEDIILTDEYVHILEIFYLCTIENPQERLSAKQVLNMYKATMNELE